jgi:putative redox protein
MRRRLEVTGPLTDEQRRDLLRVANACPIHKALSGTFEVATELVE